MRRKFFSSQRPAAKLAEANGLTGEEAFAKLEEMYDGFKFHPMAERVFNPVSVGKCLSRKEFGRYWFETGTPTFLKRGLVFDLQPPYDSARWRDCEPCANPKSTIGRMEANG